MESVIDSTATPSGSNLSFVTHPYGSVHSLTGNLHCRAELIARYKLKGDDMQDQDEGFPRDVEPMLGETKDDFETLLNDYAKTSGEDPFKKNAEIVAQRVESLLDNIKKGELNLATNYVQLGNQLLNVRSNKYWVPLGFSNFGKYIESVKDRIQIGRTQLYLYISTVEKLLPSVSESQLNQMGISKAVELQRVVSQTGAQPTQELIDFALDPSHTRESVKGEVFKHLNIQTPTTETGIYFELGCYVTQEEREEIQRGLDVATKIDPVIPNDWPDNNRNKEILLRLIREFLGTYESEVTPPEVTHEQE